MYNFEQIVTSVLSFTEQQIGCSRVPRARKNLTTAAILFHQGNTETALKFCHYQTSYTVQQTKKSVIHDDRIYFQQESKVVPTFYKLSEQTIRSV